ncbi:hypothetical protein Q31b_13260 [Novipirellula aureliae]|uniref:Uncharacterized protein n=1 Tax=Novipirellula aureliae TaxID=2527966 RepID=A0A5C6E5K3_9BACT|nr:hypothetical protein Q31b_13260 [Novipirellula aureliae]
MKWVWKKVKMRFDLPDHCRVAPIVAGRGVRRTLLLSGKNTHAAIRAFDDSPRITSTGDHHPGDPLNVALTGINVLYHGWAGLPCLSRNITTSRPHWIRRSLDNTTITFLNG